MATLLINPALILKSSLDPIMVRLAGLLSSTADPAALAPAGIAISAIDMIYFLTIGKIDPKKGAINHASRLLD